MSGIPSFERFNYLLRTNKHIERKLIFDLLHAASVRIGFSEHWYLGFGSMWFGDFRLADRQLGIHDMYSIERDQADRAEYNKPFAGVKVIPGHSGKAILDFPDEQWKKPFIAWLDYDGQLVKEVVADLNALIAKAAPNSVIIVTLNGSRGTYRARGLNRPPKRDELGVGVIETLLGANAIAARFQPTQTPGGAWIDVTESDFPECIADATLTYMQHHTTSIARKDGGHRLRFYPLYQLHHQDGADMVTVGGAIGHDIPNKAVNAQEGSASSRSNSSEIEKTKSHSSPWQQTLASQPLLAGPNGSVLFNRLNLIPLTVKEKITLDTCLPAPQDEQAFLTEARARGLKLADEEMKKYRRYYRHFPTFVETPL